jgi:predicted transcriptional regulator
MSKKNKKNKGKSESTNKTRILLRLQKSEAFSQESAKTMKELGFSDAKKYERHLELLESEGLIKKDTRSDNQKYWLIKDKIKPKKKSGNSSFVIIWFASTFVLLFIFVLFFQP